MWSKRVSTCKAGQLFLGVRLTDSSYDGAARVLIPCGGKEKGVVHVLLLPTGSGFVPASLPWAFDSEACGFMTNRCFDTSTLSHCGPAYMQW